MIKNFDSEENVVSHYFTNRYGIGWEIIDYNSDILYETRKTGSQNTT